MDQAITRAAGATPSIMPPAAAPRLVGEFQGYVDGQPSVVWADRKNMPQVGSKLYALSPRAAVSRSWSILLTSANHGTVGPIGSTFPHAGERHERVVVVEVPAGAGAPIDQVNLQFVTGTARQADVDRALKAALAWANEEYVCARNLGKGGPGTHEACDAKKAECIAAISALGTPVAAQAGQVAVPEMTDAHIVAVWQGMPGGPEGWLKQFGYLQFARALLAAAPSAPAVAQQAPMAVDGVRWDLFPGYLIDHHENEVMTEEGLQAALASMLKDPHYLAALDATPSPAKESK